MTPGQSKRPRSIAGWVLPAMLIFVAADAFLVYKVSSALNVLAVEHESSSSLPCRAIPTRLILEDPVCAQKLLDSMNVTKVRIHQGGAASWQADASAPAEVQDFSTETSGR